jgi:hypothetical protein
MEPITTNAEQNLAPRKRLVLQSIEAVRQKFVESPDIFLTEEDVRSHLFANLLREPFSVVKTTEDNGRSIELHSEIRWYGHGETKMKCRSDIVIIAPSTLTTTASGLELPSKQFGFNEFSTIIELKLRRSSKESDAKFLKKIKEDIEKLEKIRRYVQSDFDGHVVIFDKGNDLEQRVHDLRNEHNFTIVYSHSNPRDRNRQPHHPAVEH